MVTAKNRSVALRTNGQLKGNQRAIKGQPKGKQNLAFKPFIEVEGQLKGNQRAIKGQLKGNPIKEKEKEKEKEYICAFVNNIGSMYPQKKKSYIRYIYIFHICKFA